LGIIFEQDYIPPANGKNIDAAGAGATSVSPGWLTQLNLLWSGKGVRFRLILFAATALPHA
jgi:hypothetical protein